MAERTLLLVTDLQRGGTPTVVRELAVRLTTTGAIVEVACLSPWGPVADDLTAAGLRVTALNAIGPADLRVLPRLLRLLRDRQFHTVFSFLMHANALAAMASLAHGPVRWIQSIQTTQPTPRWHWMVQRAAQHAAECVVVPSEAVATIAREWSGMPAEKIVVIPNAVDLESLRNDQPVALSSAAPSPYPITFLGRLDPVKDVPTLIDAVALLGDRVHLDVYGDGADRGRIEQRIAVHRLGDRVSLHGSVARPIDALSGSGLLVLPSLAEGFGLVLIEAMAAGVPVVASDIPAVREVVKAGENGLLAPVGDAGEFAEAVATIVSSATLRRNLVDNGRRRVAEYFTWDAILPRYQALLATPAPR